MILLNKIFRRSPPAAASEWAPAPPDRDDVDLGEFLRIDRRSAPGCRTCGERARTELSTETSDRVEYLCYDCLPTFLELFADPRISEWTIVRLP